MSVNKVILIGNLGQDPEIRQFDNGMIATLSVATSERWTDKTTGERKEHTEWHRVILNNRTAEIAEQYLKKGAKVYIEGTIRTRKWTDKNTGQDRYSTEIRGDHMQMLGTRDDNPQPTSYTRTTPPQGYQQAPQGYQQPQQGYQQPMQQAPQQHKSPAQAYTPPLSYGAKVSDDDMPF